MVHRIHLDPFADLAGFRRAVRSLVAANSRPEDVLWSSGAAPGLFGEEQLPEGAPVALPRAFAELISMVVCHRDPERYALLYSLVWRFSTGERALLEVASDPLVHRLRLMEKSVRREIHKMHAFVRFRRIALAAGEERFAAWFEPDHFIVEASSPFFVERFPSMNWLIVTPVGSLHWDGAALQIGPPGDRRDIPTGDDFEAGWRSYYESTFNPARTNPVLMRAEMPKKYWRNMPETAAIPDLIRKAPLRVETMIEREATMPTRRMPDKAIAARNTEPETLDELNAIIAASDPLVPGATRAVLGEGPVGAAVAFVGEQPGDQEDQEGRPFVGPAGQMLNKALAEIGFDRATAYVTNAVKHFKFERRGKRRIHQSPTAGEIKHYRWWLKKEIDLVHPRLVVALGGTAVQALLGKAVPVTKVRGPAELLERPGFVTVHPSYLLRIPDAAAKAEAYQAFLADLRKIKELAEAA